MGLIIGLVGAVLAIGLAAFLFIRNKNNYKFEGKYWIHNKNIDRKSIEESFGRTFGHKDSLVLIDKPENFKMEKDNETSAKHNSLKELEEGLVSTLPMGLVNSMMNNVRKYGSSFIVYCSEQDRQFPNEWVNVLWVTPVVD